MLVVNVFYGFPMMSVNAEDATLSWESRIFGNSVSAATNNISVNADNSVTIESTKGKISNNADGIAFRYAGIDPTKPFQFSAKAHVESFTAGDKQVSFGLMLRNTVGTDGSTSGHTSNFIAVGALNQRIQAFSRIGTASDADSNAKLDTPIDLTDTATVPKAGDDYVLSIIKTDDNKCIVSSGNQSAVIDAKDLFIGDKAYLGFFSARNAKVTFSDYKLVTDVSNLEITKKPSKTDLLIGQEVDLTGLVVTATDFKGVKKTLTVNDYTISGFDKNKEGTQSITVNYGGKSVAIDVKLMPLTLTGIQIANTPAKTTYYLDDKLDTLGMVVNSIYNNGDAKTLSLSDFAISGFDSSKQGTKEITVTLNSDPTIKASFNVTIEDNNIMSLEITRQPVKTQYYLGDKLDLKGMVVSALYGGSLKQMLLPAEYTVDSSGFDTTSVAVKNVIISYKGKEARLQLPVKEKTLTGVEVINLPTTTYFVGAKFDPTGIVVAKVFDSGERETLAASEYSVDSSAFKSETPGTYNIEIVPKNTSLKAFTFPVTIRAKTTYTWKSIIFGQSTSSKANKIEPSEAGAVKGTITLKAGSNADGITGGKVTGAHDGISFYYTEIDGSKDNFELSADIKVIEFAKTTPDNQEAFGIMARDAIGENGNADVFSSNVVGAGGYRGTTQAFIRTGVKSSLGNEGTVQTATAWATARPDASNTGAGKYRLALRKTNSGYTASLNNLADNTVIFYQPDALVVQDSKIYVGFYTARVATIEVSNVDFKVTASATDAAKALPAPTAETSSISVVSLAGTSKIDYALKFIPTVNGTVTIKQGEKVIATDVPVIANQTFSQNTNLAANSVTNFTVTFTPDNSQTLLSYDRIVTNFAVTNKAFITADGAIFVSPKGSITALGTKEDPLDLDTAIQYLKEGQTIYMLGGTYSRTAPVAIPAGNDGTEKAIKTLSAYNGESVVLDFGGKSRGFTLGANYWHIYGIDVTKTVSTGVIIGGNNNVFEFCKAYGNGDTGIQISRIGTGSRETWPSNNLILNCESYDNKDPSENNADGFAAKLTCGEGNVFRGCISHNNIDDGWDLYTKAETGPIGAVVIEDCIAYNNGTLTNGYLGKGDKNGFKLGGEGIAVPHIIKNSLAFSNGATGFTSNSNPAGQVYNCVSYDNTGSNINFSSFAEIPVSYKIDSFASYRSKSGATDVYPETAIIDSNYFYTGTASVNKLWVTLKDSDFASLVSTVPYLRGKDGSIIKGDFLKFVGPAKTSSNSLKDTKNHWAEKDIASLVEKGIVNGYEDGKFNPDAQITRAEFTTILVKAFKFIPQSGKAFKDSANHWAKDYIGVAAKNNIVKGYDDGNFGADDYITREQMTLMVINAVKLNAVSGTPSFKDNTAISDWAKAAVIEGVKDGIVKGYADNTFKPQDNATRAEAVTVIVNALKLQK